MLRLSPSHPPLWRTTTSLQLGAEDAVRIDDVSVWQERLLDALHGGIPAAMVVPLARTLGAPQADAERFAQRIGGALVPDPPAPLAVRAELPGGLSRPEADALAHGWRAGSLTVHASPWPEAAGRQEGPVVLVADQLTEPRRAAALMRADVTHLPIVLAGDRVVVGPLVVPGRTACLSCLHAHRTDADPGWPVIAAQLIGRTRTPTDTGLVLEAAVLAARILHGRAGAVTGAHDRAEGASLSVTLSLADARRVWRVHHPHPGCPCRSPAGIGTAVEAGPRPPRETTRATGCGPHA